MSAVDHPADGGRGRAGSRRALVVVDVQNDFCEGGSLAVAGGAAVAAGVAELLTHARADYDVVVATADWHIDPGAHFSDQPDYVDSWPVHCVAGTHGAAFHPAFAPAARRVDAVFHKGEYSAAYSGFEGFEAPAEGAAGTPGAPPVALDAWLRGRGISAVDVVGIATDHCVRATALDAARAGFSVRVLLDLCAGVAQASTSAALGELRAAGIDVVTSQA